MEIALVDGVRSLPTPGSTGICQICGQGAIAKCGEQIAWHWAHEGRRGCDPWWENEGPWHRAWKARFPAAYREVVARDANGEVHIADLKLENGMVIELQHSAMPPDELRSRERFYGNMIWIVDAEPFLSNVTIFDALPDPTFSFVNDLDFVTPKPEWRSHRRRQMQSFDNLMFFRRSERDPDLNAAILHSGRELLPQLWETYAGHHLFFWNRPRHVWYQTTAPTFLDLGDGRLAQLMRYGTRPDAIWCIKFMSKEQFIAELLRPR